VNERVVLFGPRSEQLGILSTPDDSQRSLDRPAILMWNVGVNHRVGPFRVYVDLSRRLASVGFVAFRFDVSGLGDSEIRREPVPDAEREELDLKDAMDVVTRRTGASSFILVGFCSSVDAAHRVTMKDPRVVGAVHIEGYAFQNDGFRRYFPLRLLSKERWERLLRVKARAFIPSLAGPFGGRQAPAAIYKRDYPAWSDFTRDLAELTDRGLRLLFLYVGGDTDFNHESQFWEMFGSPRTDARRIEVQYYPKVDHTFFSIDGRSRAVERIVSWLLANFATGAASRPARSAMET
jgi:hypothetical protein